MTHHVETHNGPVVHSGGYLHIQGAAYNPPETIIPKLGTGVELLYVKDNPLPSAANGYGILQAYSRDTSSFRDLRLSGRNVIIDVPAGGTVTLPPGTTQALLGQWYAPSAWVVPGANVWYESDVRVPYNATGGTLRFEFAACLETPTTGNPIYAGLGIDGSLTWGSLGVFTGQANWPQQLSATVYQTNGYPGPHRVSIWLYSSIAGAHFQAGTNTTLYVTEQRA